MTHLRDMNQRPRRDTSIRHRARMRGARSTAKVGAVPRDAGGRTMARAIPELLDAPAVAPPALLVGTCATDVPAAYEELLAGSR